MPDRGHAANDGGANKNQHERPALAFKNTDDAFVARKQAWDSTCSCRIHREQASWYVDHPGQTSVARHMNAVVIARAQIQGGEVPLTESRSEFCIAAKQCGRTIGVAFGLKDLAILDTTELTDCAIYRAGQLGGCQWPCPIAQLTREKRIKAGVAGEVWFGCLVHVNGISGSEAADGGVSKPAALRIGKTAGNPRQYLLGQQILGEYG